MRENQAQRFEQACRLPRKNEMLCEIHHGPVRLDRRGQRNARQTHRQCGYPPAESDDQSGHDCSGKRPANRHAGLFQREDEAADALGSAVCENRRTGRRDRAVPQAHHQRSECDQPGVGTRHKCNAGAAHHQRELAHAQRTNPRDDTPGKERAASGCNEDQGSDDPDPARRESDISVRSRSEYRRREHRHRHQCLDSHGDDQRPYHAFHLKKMNHGGHGGHGGHGETPVNGK